MPEAPKQPVVNEREVVQSIRKKLKHRTADTSPKCWLKTSQPLLQEVMGAGPRGIPYGRVYEVAGAESGAKSGLMMELAGEAAKDGAYVGWIDLECAWDDEWAVKRGLNPEQVALFQVEILERSTKEGEEDTEETPGKARFELMSAEEILKEAETWVRTKIISDPNAKIFLALDSISAIMPKAEEEKGMEKDAMAVQARFTSKMLRRWTPIARTHNIIFVLINQLRTNPGIAFGNPEYTTGGWALRFYPSVRIRVKRLGGAGGLMVSGGKRIGIKGVIQNIKNKAGGSEGVEVGYKFFFNQRAKFVQAKDVKSVNG